MGIGKLYQVEFGKNLVDMLCSGSHAEFFVVL